MTGKLVPIKLVENDFNFGAWGFIGLDLFSVCTVTQWEMKMQTIQYRTSTIWEMKKINIQNVLQKSGLYNISNARYFEKRFT